MIFPITTCLIQNFPLVLLLRDRSYKGSCDAELGVTVCNPPDNFSAVSMREQ